MFFMLIRTQVIEEDLKRLLTGLARHLFGDVEMRWRDDFFPFTEPSFELDVFFKVQFDGILHYCFLWLKYFAQCVAS